MSKITSGDMGGGGEGRRGKASKANDEDDDESTTITDPRQQSRRLLVDLPDPHFQVDQGKIHVTRPWVNDIIMTATNRGIDLSKLKKKAVLSEEQRAERRRRRLEMEMERKKALRAAQRRLRLAKKMAADALNGESGEQKVKYLERHFKLFFPPYLNLDFSLKCLYQKFKIKNEYRIMKKKKQLT